MKPQLPNNGEREFIEECMMKIREGDCSISDVSALRTLLMKDPEARRIYLRINQIEGLLQASRDEVDASAPSSSRRLLGMPMGHLMSVACGAGIAAAVALLLHFTFLAYRPGQSAGTSKDPVEPPVASLRSDFNAHFENNRIDGRQTFGEGKLALDRGIAQIGFLNGAEIVIEGKCGFEIIDEKTVVLNYGKMWVYCPAEARGFRVLTPNGREVIDLGTEFGVEVTPDGLTDVHVFDGLVDVVDPLIDTHRLMAGKAISWSGTTGFPELEEADFGKFVTSSTLAQKRLAEYQSRIRMRSDLLLNYDFSDTADNEIRNLAINSDKGSNGLILGGISVSGRVKGLRAFQFENVGDGIALELGSPENLTSLTLGMWVKIDRFDTSLSTLINSNGWEPGDIHFQAGRDGNLKVSIHGGEEFTSPSGSVDTGVWHFLAVTWDSESRNAQLYCDGSPLRTIQTASITPRIANLVPQFGKCRIGSWSGSRPNPLDRDLKGRVDEVLIFDHALAAEEIAELYEAGRP